MRTNSNGHVSVSLLAGNIAATSRPMHSEIGQQIRMNDDFYFHITPQTARQWIEVLEPIAKEADV